MAARKAMLGHKIRRLRRDREVNQAQLAERLGISASYLNLIESNQRPVTVEILLKLGQIFDLDLASFAEDEGERLVGGLSEVFGDPLFATPRPGTAGLKRQDIIDLAAQAPAAAEALKLTADDLRRLNLVDAVVPEPMGGAHRDPAATLKAVGDKVWESLEPLLAYDGATLRARRREKFLEMGRNSVV